MHVLISRACLFIVALTALAAAIPASAAHQSGGFVYVMTNKPQPFDPAQPGSGNTIVRYSRAANGALTRLQEVSTGGAGGTGNGVGALDPLGSQDSLVLAGAGSTLLAVNAGSNQLSSLTLGASGLQLASIADSHGTFPNSVAVHGDLVYVLNAHSPNIAGFRLSASGVLSDIAGAVYAVPGASAAKPHDIRFSPDGTRLIVTVEGTNQIVVFALDNDGTVGSVATHPAAGVAPFGFKFGRNEVLANAEAMSGSVSSYLLTDDTLQVISAAVPDGGAATCWISLTADGKFGFVSNTGSGTISSYHIAANGTIGVENAVAASLNGGAPINSALSNDSAFLYVVDSAGGRVFFFGVHGASLIALGSVAGLPLTVQGVAAQ